jgi:hypothetical protein
VSNKSKRPRLVKIAIPSWELQQIRRTLESCGIDETAIFPDLEALGRAVAINWRSETPGLPHDGVCTRLGKSRAHGVRVFAIRKIRRGTKVFGSDDAGMVWIDKHKTERLPNRIKKLYADFAVLKNGRYGCPISFNQLTPSWYERVADEPQRPAASLPSVPFALRSHNVSTIPEPASARIQSRPHGPHAPPRRPTQKLEDRLRAGGGPAKIERQHRAGKMAARERIAALIDPGTPFLEIGLLLAYDQYDGEAPCLGSVTGIGKIEGRYAVIIAGDATVKAGSWWPETVTKGLRAQEIAMRNRVPIVYLVDSAGVNLPYQDRIFPGQYGGGRIFYYNSLMRRKLRVPQIAAVMGPCIAGGAYLPALSDYIIMVEGTSFMGLGGPNLVKGATGQVVDSESIGGARMHTTVSGVAHYMAKDDAECLARIRQRFRELPAPAEPAARPSARASHRRYLRRASREPPPALRYRGSRLPHFRRGRLHRIPAGLRARDAVRQRAPVRPPGGHHRQPPRLPALGRPPAHRRHRLHRIRAQSSLFRGTQRAAGLPARSICRTFPASW